MPNLSVCEDFSFPFSPYETQVQFMTALFNALEEKKLGIFESPTGTGKSLSLICGSLSWLNSHSASHKEQLKSIVDEKIEDEDDADWFNSTTKKIQKENERKVAKKELDRIELNEKRINDLKLKYEKLKSRYEDKRKQEKKEFTNFEKGSQEIQKSATDLVDDPNECDFSAVEDEYILEDYNSENESSDGYSDEEEEEESCLKIFYCSRTHSQLAQFVREVQKTEFRRDTRVVSLGSRKNMCIHEGVNQLPSLAMINEKCLDLQKKGKGIASKVEDNKTVKKRKGSSSSCPFNKQRNIQTLSDQILIGVQDIEQLVSVGRKTEACPYYATRKSIKDSQLVVLPYNCLLHRGTRKASNIKLKDNVVIIDEAHNLLETIGNIHSALLSYHQLCDSRNQLSEYLRRFQKRLSPKNLLYIKQILFIINAYTKLLFDGSKPQSPQPYNSSVIGSRVLSLQEFLHQTFTDNINIFKLVQYIENSKIAQKLHGYRKVFNGEVKLKAKILENKDNTNTFLAKMLKNDKSYQPNLQNVNTDDASIPSDDRGCGSPLLGLTEFLKALTGGDGNGEGRIVVQSSKDSNGGKSFIKYLLLNPASQFHDIVKECRAVILAGGTMSPMEEFKQQLFLSAGATSDRIFEFSCGHVVPEENVLPLVLTQGPSSVPLDFTYKSRKEPRMLDELGRTLCNFCKIIPGGIVIFFPSYEYEEYVSEYFRKEKILDNISSKKSVFREPKKSNELDKVLNDYSNASKRNHDGKRGAVLFSVVGGKMSEGINFSDDLGRCVVMVGLPYPNSTSPELREKMEYLNKHFTSNADGKTAGTSYYENLCFKAVNQSVGRSIRHRDDYGTILFLDKRYALESSRVNLSSWIRTKTRVCNTFGQAVSSVSKFFASKKMSNN